jgi:hypothetical protein
MSTRDLFSTNRTWGQFYDILYQFSDEYNNIKIYSNENFPHYISAVLLLEMSQICGLRKQEM